MKLTKNILREMVKEALQETDGYSNLVKKSGEVPHNCATHMEWKSSTYKNKYGNVIGEVIHHKLLEDGSIPSYNVKFGNNTIKNIPADKLIAVKEQKHSHEADEPEEEDD
jgi:hypothetical protein